MVFICSSVIRWRLGCMPSRSVMSCTVICLPLSVMVSSFSRGHGFEDELALEDFFSEHLCRAPGGGGNDVEVARVLGRVVAQAFDLHEDRYALAVEHRAVDQLVARHVLLHLADHVVDGLRDGGLVGLALHEAV